VTLADNGVALVTGGSRGLGRSTALALARGGIDVIVTYRTQKRTALEVVHEIEAQDRKAAALPLDVGNVPTIPAFISGLRPVRRSSRYRRNIGLFNQVSW
jgi:NAD(P)-dependent dehydrogenase (short-subunit alcohol dehydrogenase family)